MTKRKLKVILLRLITRPSRAYVSRSLRDYNKTGILTNWANQADRG